MQLQGVRSVRCIVTSSANTTQAEFVSLLRSTLCESANVVVDVMVLKSGLFNERLGLAHLQTILQCRDQLYLSSHIDTDCHVMLRAFAALQYVLLRQFNVSVRPSPLDKQHVDAENSNISNNGGVNNSSTNTNNNAPVSSRAVVAVKQIVLHSFMFIDRNTMEALRIVPSPRRQQQQQYAQQQRQQRQSLSAMAPPPSVLGVGEKASGEKRARRYPFQRKPLQVRVS